MTPRHHNLTNPNSIATLAAVATCGGLSARAATGHTARSESHPNHNPSAPVPTLTAPGDPRNVVRTEAGTGKVRSGIFRVDKYADGETPGVDQPYESHEIRNAYTNVGGALLLALLIGAGGQAFDNGHAYIGVGDSTTANAATQTDLQATQNFLRVGMVSGYPQISGQVCTWQASFGSAQANYAWNEIALFNASTAGTMLSRIVSNLGTKSGGTWVISYTITVP